MFRADLHIHSTCSDGEMTPEELVKHARASGLSGLCITDHDTIEAYPEVLEVAKREGMAMGTGVEFSCHCEGISVHVLGYGFDPQGGALKTFCARHKKRREVRNKAILEKLRACGIDIDATELKEQQIGRPHIAALLVKKGVVGTIKEAFKNYLAEGKRCYVQGDLFSIEETIDIIHQDGGKAFLAHPHLLPDRRSWQKRLFARPFDGLEGHYARFDAAKEEKWLKLAQEKGWLISGGSDFHGSAKPHIPIGCSWVDKEVFNRIF